MLLQQWKIATRLRAGFAVMVVMLSAVSAFGLSNMADSQHRLEQITRVNSLKAQLATRMRNTVYERMILLRNVALVSSASAMQSEMERISAELRRYRAAQGQLSALFAQRPTRTELDLMEKIRRADAAALPLIDKAATLALAAQADQMYEVLVSEILPVQAQWMASLDALVRFEDSLSEQAAGQAQLAYDQAFWLMLLMGVAAVLIAIAVSLLLARSMLGQLGGELGYAMAIAGKIAAGDLELEIVTRDGDSASLLAAMKTMRDSLARLVGSVRHHAESIAGASDEIAAGNQDLSSRTEQQAGASQQTTSLLEQVSGAVAHNADKAGTASTMARSAATAAAHGRQVVEQVVSSMASMNASAGKIGDIVGVIDAIAFQTNILALNAAVEAARAGEQGRGFAVVAAEVRMLAHRSGGAAKEIKELIHNSVHEASLALALAQRAGAAMHEIADSINQVAALMVAIAAASEQQRSGIALVGAAMNQIDDDTQHNAALVEQAAAAADQLRSMAVDLACAVRVFKLDGGAVPRERVLALR